MVESHQQIVKQIKLSKLKDLLWQVQTELSQYTKSNIVVERVLKKACP